ncbi:hypothetical protein LguiA_025134 [Lonicera macranthoides]
MQRQERIFGTFSSCRGVASETKSHNDHFSITSPLLMNLVFLLVATDIVFHGSALQMQLHPQAWLKEGKNHQEMELPHQNAASKHEKPKRKASRLFVILLDQGLFTVYKRLFVVCLALNITALFLAVTGRFDYGRNRATLFSIGNILALTLCRSEAFLRIVFWLAVILLGWSWVPLRLKTATVALLQSLGGIHSGCGIFSIAWLTYSLVLTLKDRDSTSTEIIAVASAILSPCLILVGHIPTYPPPPPQHIQEDSSVCWLDRPRPPLGIHNPYNLLRSEPKILQQ